MKRTLRTSISLLLVMPVSLVFAGSVSADLLPYSESLSREVGNVVAAQDAELEETEGTDSDTDDTTDNTEPGLDEDPFLGGDGHSEDETTTDSDNGSNDPAQQQPSAQVPEPGLLALFGIGALAMAAATGRRRLGS